MQLQQTPSRREAPRPPFFPQEHPEPAPQPRAKPGPVPVVESHIQPIYDPPKPLWRRMADATAGYLITNFTSMLAFVLFRLLNRTKVYNRHKVGLEKNTLILANHRTMIDSYLIGHITSWPHGLIRPYMLPYHPAAKENFFRNKVIGWFSARWKCIPVRRRVRDFEALGRMIAALPQGQMIIFPEGTRSRTGELLRGRPGTGKLIRETRCRAIPCYVAGMDQVLPIGTARPRLFKSIRIIFGDPISFDDLFELPDTKETSQKIIDRVMEHIAALKTELEAIEAREAERKKSRSLALAKLFSGPASLLKRR